MGTNKKSIVVLFVEGETEKEFYETLIKYYRSISIVPISRCKILNVKGIGRFESKVPSKLKLEIIPKSQNANIKVVCCYDTDTFELAQKPPVNWEIVREKINSLNAEFYQVKAVKMIEDWFLLDLNGLCTFLNIKKPSNLNGNSGYKKLQDLFKKGKKVYLKGSYTHKFLPCLDIQLIRDKIKDQLVVLEKALNVKLK